MNDFRIPCALRKSWFQFLAALALLLPLAGCTPAETGANFPAVEILHPPTKAPTATLPQPQDFDLSHSLDASGVVQSRIELASPDGCLHVEIEAGAKVVDENGAPPQHLTIAQDYPGKLPMEAFSVPISYAYRFGPGEFHFSQPAKLVYRCLKNYKLTLLSEMSLGMKGDDGDWQQWSIQGDENQVWIMLESLSPAWRYILAGPAPMGS